MEKIGIFCAACDNIDQIYFDAANRLGEWMGHTRKTLVYGGADMGLMGEVAKAVKAGGGRVFGVVPTKLEEGGHVSDLLDVTFACNNLSDRKDIMIQESEVMVALPGGVGTLDEVFTVAASNSIGYHDKRIILYNVNGFWNELVSLMNGLSDKGFLRHEVEHYFVLANTLEELKTLIE